MQHSVTSHFQTENRVDGETAVVALQGEINGTVEEALTTAYEKAAAHLPASVILDFTQVDYINSTGIALIVGILAKARAAHLPLKAVGLSEHFREIFTITRLSDFIEIE